MNTIGSVWCPRRDSLLEEDQEIPQLLTELTSDLEVVEDDDEDAILPAPTPQSVEQDFQVHFQTEPDSLPTLYTSHDSTGPIHRRERDDQLSDHAYQRQNMLGRTIHRKLTALQDTIKDKQMHLDV